MKRTVIRRGSVPDAGPAVGAAVRAKFYGRDDVAVRVRGQRHYVTPKGAPEERQSRCNVCGGTFAARGYCCGCGAPA